MEWNLARAFRCSLGRSPYSMLSIGRHRRVLRLSENRISMHRLKLEKTVRFLMFAVVGLALIGRAFGVTPPAGVSVIYALVPKERLADAVKGKIEALEIEAAWRTQMMAKPGPPVYPMNLANEKYSIVVFIENPPQSLVWGRIAFPIQSARNPVVLNVSLAPGYSGTYVIDGGGLILPEIPVQHRPSAWLDVHVE